jgi:hypothetical protein
MSKFTPGPWHVQGVCETTVVDKHRNIIAEIEGDYDDPDHLTFMVANARLIAAAPDLVEALRDAIDCVKEWAAYASEYFQDKHALVGDLARLRAVLEKAGVE